MTADRAAPCHTTEIYTSQINIDLHVPVTVTDTCPCQYKDMFRLFSSTPNLQSESKMRSMKSTCCRGNVLQSPAEVISTNCIEKCCGCDLKNFFLAIGVIVFSQGCESEGKVACSMGRKETVREVGNLPHAQKLRTFSFWEESSRELHIFWIVDILPVSNRIDPQSLKVLNY